MHFCNVLPRVVHHQVFSADIYVRLFGYALLPALAGASPRNCAYASRDGGVYVGVSSSLLYVVIE